MEFFLILQILFDAVFLFGILFLFHYSVHHSKKKGEESDVLKNLQVQEMKENLQELLMTLKQLGKEVSENIREQVELAEEKAEKLKKIVARLGKDLEKAQTLAAEVGDERQQLEEKANAIQAAKKSFPKVYPSADQAFLGFKTDSEAVKGRNSNPLSRGEKGGVGFSSDIVKEVYRLADTKIGANEIIRRTKLTRAEVQLILNLRGNRFTTPN